MALHHIWLQLQEPNTQWVLAGTLLLGMASGVLGSFVLLRRQSLIGDAMAHSALPGVCLAFLIAGEKTMLFFLIGATAAGLAGTWCIQNITEHSKTKEDSAIGIVLSVFFGIGIILLTYIQRLGSGSQSGLDSFLFGQAASLVKQDIVIIGVISAVLLLLCAVFFKEFKLITFDMAFAKGAGLPVRFLNGLLVFLIVCAVVIGLQTVGVILMAAMLITPAIAARYWTERLTVMIVLSGLIGGLSGVAGTLLSTTTDGMATGPLIILSAASVFLFSLLFAPDRGLVSKTVKLFRLRKKTAFEQTLSAIYEMSEQTNETSVTGQMLKKEWERPIRKLEKKGYLKRSGAEQWRMTEAGLTKGYEIVLSQRMYEVYLMHETELAGIETAARDEFHPDLLPKELKEKLLQLLRLHGRMPNESLQKEKGGAYNEL